MIWLKAWDALVNMGMVKAVAVRAVVDDKIVGGRHLGWALTIMTDCGCSQVVAFHADRAVIARVFEAVAGQLEYPAAFGSLVIDLDAVLRGLDIDPESVIPTDIRDQRRQLADLARVKPSDPEEGR